MERFRFTTTPFTRELRIEHRFKSDENIAESEKIIDIINQRQSAALIGPAGSGKTVILRSVLEKLSESRYRIAYLKLADLSARDMCRQVALGLGLPSSGNYPSLVRALEEQFRSGFTNQAMRQVLIFDDAHELRPESMRLMRLFTNFEMDSKLIVSIILSGHLQLKKNLMLPEMEDIRQRLNYCGEIGLMSREVSRTYVNHRIKIAGAPKSPFSADALEALYEISQGNMRAIDKLALESLKVTAKGDSTSVSAAEVAIARGNLWM